MIDARLLPLQRWALAPLADRLHRAGIGADRITLAGFGLGLLAAGAAALSLWPAALLFLALNRLADGLDGEVARRAGPTDRGAFLDITLDFAFYGLFPLGFALADPAANALPAAVMIAAFIGTGSSFLAFALLAERRGLRALAYPTKGMHYLGGLTEGAETIAVFVAMCLWPAAFPALALVFAAACSVTTLSRWRQGWVAFSGQAARAERF